MTPSPTPTTEQPSKAGDPLAGPKAIVDETVDIAKSALPNARQNGSTNDPKVNKKAPESDVVAQTRLAIICDESFSDQLVGKVVAVLQKRTLGFGGVIVALLIAALSFILYSHLPETVNSKVASALTDDRNRSIDQSKQIGALVEQVRQSESKFAKLDEILTALTEIKTESKLRFESSDKEVQRAVAEFRESKKEIDARFFELLTGFSKQTSLINLAERVTVAQTQNAETRKQIQDTAAELASNKIFASEPRTTGAVASIVASLSDGGQNEDVDSLERIWHEHARASFPLSMQFLRHYGWDAISVRNGQPPVNHRFYAYAHLLRSLGHDGAVLAYELTLAFSASSKGAEYSTNHVKETLSEFVRNLNRLEEGAPRDAALHAQEFLTPFCKTKQTIDPKSVRSEAARANLRRFREAYQTEFQAIAIIGDVHLESDATSRTNEGYTTGRDRSIDVP